MNISAISNTINPFKQKQASSDKVSFKGIYVEDIADLGDVSEKGIPARFKKSDALLLGEIAQDYPNQDCFIKRGYGGMPRLEYRERPPVIQNFSTSLVGQYNITPINPNDKDNPTVSLLVNEDDPINRMICIPSCISLNPSLPFTVKAGFEVHKKLIEKKMQIMEMIGKSDEIDLGEETLTEKAHKGIAETEEAVRRYLLESAYVALSDRASARQIYASNLPKVQSRLDAKRTLDLTTSVAKQPLPDASLKNDFDICEEATKKYPDYNENKEANEQLLKYMVTHGIVLN